MAHERRTILDGRSPHADRLAVASARIYGRHRGRRAWRRYGTAQPSDYLTAAAWWARTGLIAAALIVASDRWPVWLA